jgi:hypothetical protein
MKKLALALLITFAFSCKKKDPHDHLRFIGVESVPTCGDAHDGVTTCVADGLVYTCVYHTTTTGDGCRGPADYAQCAPAPVVVPSAEHH